MSWVAELADPSFERLKELIVQATPLKAVTLDGYAAKAVLVRRLMLMDHGVRGEFVRDGDSTDLAWSLVNDLAGMAT